MEEEGHRETLYSGRFHILEKSPSPSVFGKKELFTCQLSESLAKKHYVLSLFSCPSRTPTAVASAFNSSLNSVAVDPTDILRAASSETDLITIEFARDRRGNITVSKRASNHLESLFEIQFSLRQFPCAADFRRNDPEMRCAPMVAAACCGGIVGFPILHVEGVRHDASAGLKVENLRAQRHVDTWQQKHGNDLCLGKISFEQIGFDEAGLVANTFFGGIALR